MWRLLSALAVGLLALCALPMGAAPARAGAALAGPARAARTPVRLAPAPGEWWFAAWQVQRKVWPLSQGAGVTVAEVESGIRYAVTHGAQVIDMPFGIGQASPVRCDPAPQAAVAYALRHDVVLVASSGNANLFAGPDEPASCAGVLAVGGTEPDGTLWPDSTREPYVAVTAPGDHMVYVGRDGRFTTTGAGTSFAAALTAGAAALIRSRYPHMPWYEVDQRLTGTATPAGHPVPNDGYGYGIVNLARAVDASAYPVPASAPDPALASYRAWLATPAGRIAAQRYGLTDPAAARLGTLRPGRIWRLRLPVGEIVATAVAAACSFVAVLLAVLWLSSRRDRSAAAPARSGAAQARPRAAPGPGRWEARTWSFGPGEADEYGWPPDLRAERRGRLELIG